MCEPSKIHNKRVYISESNGERRPLGLSTIRAKIVQLALKKILEAIFGVDFRDAAYGFRANRSCNDAQDMVDKTLMTKPLNYVLGKDIAKFFDVVCHNCLMKCLKQRVVGPSLLRIITRLANIYPSYALDRWFECVVKKRLTGFALLVRYVDDLIVCFQNGWEAEVFGKALWKRLVKFRLTISEGFKRRVCAPEESDEEKPQILFCVGAHSNPGAITPIGGGL